jgi:hypothetical protein
VNLDEEGAEIRKETRGRLADEMQDNEVFRDAIQKLRDRALHDFKTAEPNDAEALMTARLRFAVVEQFIRDIVYVSKTGKLARTALQHWREKVQQAKERQRSQ